MQVETSDQGHVRTVTFASPPLNYASEAMLAAIADALEAADRDPEVRAVVLASEGRTFCAGADLADPAGVGGAVPDGEEDPLLRFYAQVVRLFSTAKPIVAAVHGAAVGAGLGLALAADFRVASEGARFAANFTRLGFHPGFALSHTLPRLIGAQAAQLMMLTGDRYKVDDALRWGLVDRVADDALAGAQALAATIAEGAPLALIATRATLRPGMRQIVQATLAHEHAEQAKLRVTSDYAEGVAAVFARRAPTFSGR